MIKAIIEADLSSDEKLFYISELKKKSWIKLNLNNNPHPFLCLLEIRNRVQTDLNRSLL